MKIKKNDAVGIKRYTRGGGGKEVGFYFFLAILALLYTGPTRNWR